MMHTPNTPRAGYSVQSIEDARRVHPESPDPLRAPFELDRHRIIESTAFRRLEHKTQVFAPTYHDHFRTRLTHTLEVAQLARGLARHLRANEDLTETITLAHDLGHPPFGHAGEAALHACMANADGFNHNVHSLRVVDYLEHPYPSFRGLNLTLATREGLRTHATHFDEPEASAPGPSVESQIASVADRVAYALHDLEDAIGAGLVSAGDLERIQLWRDAFERLEPAHRALSLHAYRRVVLDAMQSAVVMDVIEASREALRSITCADAVRNADRRLVGPTDSMDRELGKFEDFLRERVYGHAEIAAMDEQGRARVTALFEAYRAKPEGLPERFRARIDEQGPDRVLCDYVAGMTDRFCLAEHRRLVDR